MLDRPIFSANVVIYVYWPADYKFREYVRNIVLKLGSGGEPYAIYEVGSRSMRDGQGCSILLQSPAVQLNYLDGPDDPNPPSVNCNSRGGSNENEKHKQ
ncbi:hypothetical protein BV898_05400 [Hypsibius exemplaris]|uniref:Uncharacterized protein n=1 Tax=Hypsibius exemplaris TaxID=2072580 RepID=A0A1W0WZI1_HYPEX|nr:hypothetical protein BV898_05400 [Hypsibius exemplaris]